MMLCQELIGRSVMRLFRPIQFRQKLKLQSQEILGNIEAVSCSVQAIESFLPISSDAIAISKTITRLSDQSCMTHLENELPMLKTVSKVDDSDCPAPASRQ